MKTLATVLSLLSVTAAGGAFAQSTTQQAVLGASDDAVYSVRIAGANDVIYNCKPDTVRNAAGTLIRECVRADDDDAAGVFAAGDGIGNAAPAVAVGVVAVAVAAGGGGDDAATTTTGEGS